MNRAELVEKLNIFTGFPCLLRLTVARFINIQLFDDITTLFISDNTRQCSSADSSDRMVRNS